MIVLHHCKRRVDKYDIERSRRPKQTDRTERVTAEGVCNRLAAEIRYVLFQQRVDTPVLLDHQHFSSAAADGLQSHGPDTCKEIQYSSVFPVAAENIENRLLHPLRIGSGRTRIGRRAKTPGSIVPANDLQHSRRIGPRRRPVNEDGMSERFDALPTALRRQGSLAMCGTVPTLLIQPEAYDAQPDSPPLLLWIHGRTAFKELDPGRYLRLMRRGIAICAMDLPGHGERLDLRLHEPAHIIEAILETVEEIDAVSEFAAERLGADPTRIAIGGMSAGGMAVIARLCRPHSYAAGVLEATSGNWSELPMAEEVDRATMTLIREADPMQHLGSWRPIPLLALHARHDSWIPYEGQRRFLDAVEAGGPPALVSRVTYDRTGAPGEHAGFGSMSADAKERLAAFLTEVLLCKPTTGASCP
jgi:dienelactone hydrolase